jgi:prolyl-tRNA synthetase
MNAIGSQEVSLTTLQKKSTWEKTGRWDTEVVDVWFKTQLKDGMDVGLAWSHEEAVVEMLQPFLESYKDFPVSVYQFQIKMRNELRAKSGVMRGREFLMKDMYSLHTTQEDCDAYYEKAIEAYKRCFERVGVGDSTFVSFASGGAFTKFSHEFQTLCDAGEDILFVNADKSVAVNEEVLEEAVRELSIVKEEMQPVKSAEVGNIFKFGTEKSERMGVLFTDSDGQKRPFYLASYGIGISRLMGVVVEKFADERGLVWPPAIAPFFVHLISLGENEAAEALYHTLTTEGISVLYDDRDIRAGEKFADADLLGMPVQVIVGKHFQASGTIEWKERKSGVQDEGDEAALRDYLGKQYAARHSS